MDKIITCPPLGKGYILKQNTDRHGNRAFMDAVAAGRREP
jgi:hypothetical protein